MLDTIAWTGSAMRLVDQTRLPTETVYVDITDHRHTWDAIKRPVVEAGGRLLVGFDADEFARMLG